MTPSERRKWMALAAVGLACVVATASFAYPPSRVRVSSDGTVAGLTVFVSGHSYAGGAFSTQSLVVDLQTGATLADLEKFDIVRDKQPFKQIDFNFWGITFEADPNRFYATLGTGGQTFLLHGDVKARRATVLHAGVE